MDDSIQDMSADEELALYVAMDKALHPKLADAKEDAKSDMFIRHSNDGTDRRSLMVDGTKVGTISLTYRNGAAIKEGHEAEAMDFLRSIGLTQEKPVSGWNKRFALVDGMVMDKETGCTSDSLEWKDSEPYTSVVKECKPEKVFPAIQEKYGTEAIGRLIEGE